MFGGGGGGGGGGYPSSPLTKFLWLVVLVGPIIWLRQAWV